MSDIAFYELALNIILDQLGPVGMMRFIRIRVPGPAPVIIRLNESQCHQWLDKL